MFDVIETRDECKSCGVPDAMPPIVPGSAATARACPVCGFVEELSTNRPSGVESPHANAPTFPVNKRRMAGRYS